MNSAKIQCLTKQYQDLIFSLLFDTSHRGFNMNGGPFSYHILSDGVGAIIQLKKKMSKFQSTIFKARSGNTPYVDTSVPLFPGDLDPVS